MSEQDDHIRFRTPDYWQAQRSDSLVSIGRSWKHRASSTASNDSTSSGTRRYPSLVVQDVRHRTSQGSKHSDDIDDIADAGIRSSQDSRHSSTMSSETLAPRENVDTMNVLQNFAPVAAEYFKKEEERAERMKRFPPIEPSLTATLDRLKSGQPTLRLHKRSRQTPDHEIEALKHLAKSYFPCRSDVTVYITDFKEYSADLKQCKLSEIQKFMTTKPNDVQVRWIHAPLGVGPVHSSIEDIFLHQGVGGRPFKNLGRIGWPYAKIEVLDFYDRKRFQDARDVYRFLHANSKLTKELNKECWEGFEPSFVTKGKGVLDDLKWRTTHLGLAQGWETLPDHWTASTSDIPSQLTEGLLAADYGPLDGLYPTLWQSDKQMLHKHSLFGSAQLVRDLFRCFHRGDGFLLTLSPMRGVNYLDKNFQRHLNEPGNAIFENDVASVVAFVRQQFQDTGTQKWHRASVEWLLVHLITELGVTPHADRQGQNAPTLDRAYKSILQQFKRRRDEHFNRKDRDEPASLIKDMLICKDELRRIKVLSQTREQVFESLARDIEEHEAEDIERSVEPDHPDQVTAADKIKYALARSRRETQVYERLVDDISTYLDEVYHLRSMQLRQSGIITDGQNRALVLITLVQLVFIPFATLCSYWGMNLSDINETELDQRGFWRIYGSIVVVLAIFSAFTVLSRLAWQARRFLSEEPRRKKPLMTGPVNDKLDVEGV